MTAAALLDYALPYTDEEMKCGMKKKGKIEKRIKLLLLLNDYREGKEVNFKEVQINVDYNTFLRRVNGGLIRKR